MAATTTPSFGTYEVEEADIANRALVRIGVDVILDTDEDTQQARVARRFFASTRDELLRDFPFAFALAYFYAPENITVAKKGDYLYAFDLPVDCLRILEAPGQWELLGSVVQTDEYSQEECSFTADTTLGQPTIVVGSTTGLSAGRVVSGTGIPSWAAFVSETGGVVTLSANATATGTGVAITAPRSLSIKYIAKVENPASWDAFFTDALVLRLASKMATILDGKLDLVQKLEAEFSAVFTAAKNKTSAERIPVEETEYWTER